MATINSVELYLSRTSNRTGWYIQVDIVAVGDYTDDPTEGDVLGSKRVLVDTVPTHGSQTWITFAFDTAISIFDTGFFAIHVWCDTNNYQAGGLRWYEAGDWSDAAGGEPYAGKERYWSKPYTEDPWESGGNRAYKINCSGADDNSAEATLDAYGLCSAGSSYGDGIRTYIDAAGPPNKPINPTPAHLASGIALHSTTGTWEDGGGATSYDVYFGTLSGFVSLVQSGVTDLSLALTDQKFDAYADIYYWRVDAVNEYGTTQGDEWAFTTLSFCPPLPHYTLILVDGPDFTHGDGINYGGTEGTDWFWDGYNFIRTSRKLVAAAKDTIWYEEQV